MKLFYIIPIAIGFGIDIIDIGKWVIALFRRKDLPEPSFGTLSVFFLPAWGISGLMIFGKTPSEMLNVWGIFLTILLLAFCVHLFIRHAFPLLFIMVCNYYYGRSLFDDSPLPKKVN